MLAAAIAAPLAFAAAALATVSLTSVSTDPYTNSTSQHKTEVEPDTFAYGSTIVAAFQVGRFYNGGGSNIGWARSDNGGSSWTNGFLPGTTPYSSPSGSYDRITDPSVAYDAAHGVWLINSLGLVQSGGGVSGEAVVVSPSADGGATWGNPVLVESASGNSDFDKNWIACDNNASSPYYGHCYVEWDDYGNGNRVRIRYSTDGGLTWGLPTTLPNVGVIGGQPVVQPSGTVVMPIDNAFASSVMSLVSADGGVTWSGPYAIANIASHGEAGGLRSDALPSADVDAGGTVYVAWQDCRFRKRCTSNDIVMSTSTDGVTWTAVKRIPIDAVSSTVDHFLPGLGVNPTTSGTTAQLGVTYYYYPVSKCNRKPACQLDVGFISSVNGGASWSTPTQLAGPVTPNWLPNTSGGRMVGDYLSTSFLGTTAYSVFAVANAPTSGGSDCATATPNCDEAMYVPTGGVSAAGGSIVSNALPVANAASDHASSHSAIFR